MTRVLICGGRKFGIEWKEYCWGMHQIGSVLHPYKELTIISGGARGGDEVGERWARRHGFPVEVYPADWDKYGKKAGFLRNTQMLEEALPDLVIALPGGAGTEMMCRIAEKAGVPVVRLTNKEETYNGYNQTLCGGDFRRPTEEDC